MEETGRIDWILEAAERVVPFAPDVFHWACTSGSFIQGRAFADQQIAAIEALTGRAAGSTSLAFVAAAEAANARRVSVLATYPEPAARLFADFLDAFDIEVLSLDWLAAPSGWDAAKFAPAFVGEHARRALHAEAEALLIPDTALPSLHFLADLEAELGVPLLTANAVTLWDAQRLAGRFLPLPAYGRLLGGAFQ